MIRLHRTAEGWNVTASADHRFTDKDIKKIAAHIQKDQARTIIMKGERSLHLIDIIVESIENNDTIEAADRLVLIEGLRIFDSLTCNEQEEALAKIREIGRGCAANVADDR